MAGLLNVIGKLFGNKYDKDVKEITPIIEQINAEYGKLSTLTNDELRAKTSDFKSQIADFIASDKQKIETLTKEANLSETPTEKKETLYKEIDTLEETVISKTEEILNTILPQAFA